MSVQEALKKIIAGEKLTREQSAECFRQIMEGNVSSVAVSAFLTALRITGETKEIVEGAVEVMREKCVKVKTQGIVADTCGTGGDSTGTFNISTAAAIVGSACGIKVAKHGNRAVSSKSGSADVLEKIGMNIEIMPEKAEKMLEEVNFTFLFAPLYHPAMKNVAPVRKELGFRTIFNILGPLCNPAGANVQIIGVGNSALLEIVPDVLCSFSVKKAWVFYGEDGTDEISVTGKTCVIEISGEKKESFYIEPEQFGLKRATLKEIEGGTPEENGEILRQVISGKERGPKRDAVLINTAALLYLAGNCNDIEQGIKTAREVIDSGYCKKHLEKIIEISNS
ncbi:MAG: anthranilate phosphoribosyltransferase [Candidatus Omnitrophica bacterium]|nr:anthranilate phosphoribosyltransferase [Candidatus Omnitrophota bacterium]